MREIFTDYFNITLSGSVLILAAILLRVFIRKTPGSILCVLWGIVFLRMMLPLQIETTISVLPDISKLSVSDTSIADEETPFGFYMSWETDNNIVSDLPSYVPQKKLTPQVAVIDFVCICMLLWSIGCLSMMIYTATTYIRLRLRLREAVRVENRVFESDKISAPFLFGFFAPKIYLPRYICDESRAAVIAHEEMHIRRGDNWFKLVAYFILALHWYNPLLWIGYYLMCRDIEIACDEAVVRRLDKQGRANYSLALLACEKYSRFHAGCPIAFGEINVRKRILNVLNYKKPVIWLTAFSIVAVIFLGACLTTDPVDYTHPPYYRELTGLLGEPVDVVCEELGINRDEVREEISRSSNWISVGKVDFQGVEFTLHLGFAVLNEDMVWVLNTFEYYAEFLSAEDAAFQEATVRLSHHLYRKLGRGYQWPTANNQRLDPDRLRDFSPQIMQEKLDSNRRYSGGTIVSDSWNLSQDSKKHVKDYLKRMEMSDLWENMKGNRERNYHFEPHFYLSFTAGETKETDGSRGWIRLTYRCGHQGGHYGTGDLEWERVMGGTWWMKLQNWLE